MPGRKRTAPAERYEIRAVRRALELLHTFLVQDGELSASEISKSTHLDPSTTYRLLVTLQAQGFVDHDPATGKYRPGVTCLELGSRFLLNNGIRRRAIGHMERLRQEFGETLHLAILDGPQVVYLEKLAGLHPIGFMASRVGDRAPAHCTGVGKALLAYQPDEELRKWYPHSKLTRYTEATLSDLDALRTELIKVREQGFAVDEQEHEVGVKCVAVPIFDHKGITAAMSVSGPVERMDRHIVDSTLMENLQKAGAEVSAQMGWGRGVDQLEAALADQARAAGPRQREVGRAIGVPLRRARARGSGSLR